MCACVTQNLRVHVKRKQNCLQFFLFSAKYNMNANIYTQIWTILIQILRLCYI